MLPLPMTYLIFRAPSEEAGKTWMDALELSLRCSSLLTRTMSTPRGTSGPGYLKLMSTPRDEGDMHDEETPPTSAPAILKRNLNESEIESHFRGIEDEPQTDVENIADDFTRDSQDRGSSDSDSIFGPPSNENQSGRRSSVKKRGSDQADEPIIETTYVENSPDQEVFGAIGDPSGQTEEIAEENKSLLWCLLKQVRPGMDLSKVVLPTFILEPRSFLEKLSDYYYHCDILSQAAVEDDPFQRMKMVVKWYLSGFYKKPKGLKKPYNPILGETFRCYWRHPDTDSRTFYIAEQVSHHPPISAFYVTNRKDGFCITGSILAKSKFYGNSVSAILDGTARLTFLNRGESYTLTMPYAHCKGILMGTLTLELGGKVEINCDKTGYRTEMEFKLKPFIGGNDYINSVSGKIKIGKENLGTIEGHWDREIWYRDRKQQEGVRELLWCPTPDIRSKRLVRYTVPMESQDEFESERLWRHVSEAIFRQDQIAATDEKTILEEAQRKGAKERAAKMEDWIPKYFIQDPQTGEWIYRYADNRPWDPRTDVLQYERDYIVQTKTKHKTPNIIVKTNSVVSIEGVAGLKTAEDLLRRVNSQHGSNGINYTSSRHRTESGASDEGDGSKVRRQPAMSDSTEGSHSGDNAPNISNSKPHDIRSDPRAQNRAVGSSATVQFHPDSAGNTKDNSAPRFSIQKQILDPLNDMQRNNNEKLSTIEASLQAMIQRQERLETHIAGMNRALVAQRPTRLSRLLDYGHNFLIVLVVIIAQIVINVYGPFKK